MKIGIFGGSFDPVHLEHIEIAISVKEEFKLDKILIVPAYLPPHKQKLNVSDDHRLKMLKLALSDVPSEDITIDDFEIKSKKTVYTYQTLRYIKHKYDCSTFYLIVGSDSFNSFYLWKNMEEIAEDCRFIVVRRQGYNVDTESIYFKYAHISDFTGTISSTYIRDKIKNNYDISSFVDVKVMEYIKKNELYK